MVGVQYRQNRTFQNNERKFNQQLGGDHTKKNKHPDKNEPERFWTVIWQQKKKKKNKKTTKRLNG